MIAREQVTGVILAGGRGRRMGDRDKGWLMLDERALIEHVMARLAPQVDTLIISANRYLDEYRRLGFPVVSDTLAGFPGPLAGALSAMTQAQTPWILLTPVDMPYLPSGIVEILAAASDEADIIFSHDGTRPQPLIALIRTALVEDLAVWLAGGGHKVRHWYARHRWQMADCSECEGGFFNLNTPEEYALAQGRGSPSRGDGR